MLFDTRTPASVPTEVPLALDNATARGSYCNVALVNHTDTEVVVDFAFVAPAQTGGVVVARIIMHPAQAAALNRALSEHLAQLKAEEST